ncbi:L,D-transpeptidase-like protein [Hasllibacter halocynthiae]|uniref:L,D-transpeptidase-like protein n=1 Tax=Hasllibacter halocynthiae TaxID=595589 RepID=A0A2T0X276_9RHOB|nr:L,D-transpeptidase family protein [Hasllibacter halocynthiae]PRY93041.1 L,D-transpeptidase-like protein [Hasllibacter halocynthiae]
MRILAFILLTLALTGCASKFRSYDGPAVTRIVVYKAEREVHLLHHDAVLESFDMELGFAPEGTKERYGDGRTPEGRYFIDRRNPESRYHLSLGIDYPRGVDQQRATEAGVDPGGDIFFHGTPREFAGRDDWTAGCLAIPNRDIERMYAMVGIGTPVDIYAARPAPNPMVLPDPLRPAPLGR